MTKACACRRRRRTRPNAINTLLLCCWCGGYRSLGRAKPVSFGDILEAEGFALSAYEAESFDVKYQQWKVAEATQLRDAIIERDNRIVPDLRKVGALINRVLAPMDERRREAIEIIGRVISDAVAIKQGAPSALISAGPSIGVRR